MKLQFLH